MKIFTFNTFDLKKKEIKILTLDYNFHTETFAEMCVCRRMRASIKVSNVYISDTLYKVEKDSSIRPSFCIRKTNDSLCVAFPS